MNTRFTSWLRRLTLVLLVAGALQAWAQLDTGRITGIVTDQSGAVIVDTTVKITNVRTDRAVEVKTSDTGLFSSPPLPVGVYKVEVEREGFRTSSVTDVVLHATEVKRVDLALQVGTPSEEVTVTAESVSVNTETSDLGATIDANKVANLPLNGRDFTTLMTLVPGSVTTAGFSQTSLGGFETSLAGVNILLDGADATRIDINATSTQLGRQESRISRASVDSVQEFRVLSSSYSAEYGRSVGDVVNVITKSGSNQFHGTLFEYFRNDALDARNWFARDELPDPVMRLNQFGGNLAGPIKKDKVFFFVNYEGVRQRVGVPTEAQVLSADYRALAPAAVQPVMDALPLGNGGPVLVDTDGDHILDTELRDGLNRVVREYYRTNLRHNLREDTGSVKIDVNASPTDTFSFRYNISDSFTETEYGVADGQVSPSDSTNHLFKATWNHTFGPNLINEVGFALNRPLTNSLGGGGEFGEIFQCFFCNDLDALGGAGFFTLGSMPGPALFSNRRPQLSLQVLDTVSWNKGRHNMRFGLDIRRVRTTDQLEPQRFLTWPGPDFNNYWQVSTLGYDTIEVRNTNYGFFFQDDIKLTPTFTLNLGLRYEYNTVLASDELANFDIATLTVLPTGQQLYQPDRNNFAPRVGFAWDPFGKGKTVIRGGAGIFYNPLLTGAALSLAANDEPGYNVNIFDVIFGVVVCDPPGLNFTYPLPETLPDCFLGPPAPPGTRAPYSVNALDRNMRDSYAGHWSLSVQHELLQNTVLEVAYVGNRGVKLPAGASGAGLELNLDPWGGPNRLSDAYANIRRLGNFLNSNYNALQVSLRRRVGKGLNVDANYTWSHEFDNVVNIFSAFQNSYDPKGDWSEGDIDVRHNFTVGLVYDVPVASWMPKRLAEGWQISSLFQTRTGLPVNLTMTAPFLGIDLIRPNLVPGEPLYASNYDTPFVQFNPAAFADPGVGNYGNLPRNALRGPGFAQLDLAVAKTTLLTERVGLQFRVEAFNLFNRPNFANPVGIVSDPNFGRSLSTVGSLIGTGTARQLQLVTKLNF